VIIAGIGIQGSLQFVNFQFLDRGGVAVNHTVVKIKHDRVSDRVGAEIGKGVEPELKRQVGRGFPKYGIVEYPQQAGR